MSDLYRARRPVAAALAALWIAGVNVALPAESQAEDRAKIVAFGDSTTAPRDDIPVYAELLQRELGPQGLDALVVNAGVGGNTTAMARDRFQADVLREKPQLVIIQFGINDSAVDVSKNPPAKQPRVALPEFWNNLGFFIDSLRRQNSRVILMTPNPLRWTAELRSLYGKPPYNPHDPDGFNVLLKGYAEVVRAVAQRKRVRLIDIYARYEAYDRQPGQSIDNLLLDGMHPNEKGHRLAADMLLDACGMVLGADLNRSRKSQHALRLTVPHALPLLGAEQALVARLTPPDDMNGEAVVSFHFRSSKSNGSIGSPQRISLAPGKQELIVNRTWRPEQTGRHTLIARVKPAGSASLHNPIEATQTVTVVRRPLHFHYWDMDRSLEYVTEGLVNQREQLDYWTDRGVVAQRWRGGKWTYETTDAKTPKQLGDYWLQPAGQDWPGVVIDEFLNGGPVDEILGQSLLAARQLNADFYLAAYTLSLGGEWKTRGLREAADRILIEAYEHNTGAAYGYSRILNRCRPAIQLGLGEKAIVVLGIGEALGKGNCCITTPQELRRQLHFTRYHFPAMRGVGLFGSMPPLYPEVNRQLKQFYCDPVLHVAASDSAEIHIENIGAMDAPATRVKILTGKETERRIVELPVPPLAVGDRVTVAMAGEDPEPETDYRSGCFVLGPPRIWDQEPASFRPAAVDAWPPIGRLIKRTKESFDTQPHWQLYRDAADNDGQMGNVSSATFAVDPTSSGACELQFDLDPVSTGHYANVQIGLIDEGGQARLAFELDRGDYQPGVYVCLHATNENGVRVVERLPWKIEMNHSYRFRVRYEPAGYVRAAVLDASGESLWDTGRVPTFGRLTFDHVRFGVRSHPESRIQWDSQRQAVLLHATSGPSNTVSAYVDNIAIQYFDLDE